MHLSIRYLLSGAVLCTPALSQPTTFSARTETNCGVYTVFNGQVRGSGVFGANWRLPWGRSWVRTATGPFASGSIVLHGKTDRGGWPNLVLASNGKTIRPISGSVRRSVQTTDGSFPSYARRPVRLLLTVGDVPGRRFQILAYLRSNGSGGGTHGGYARIDVGADGSWEATAGHNAGLRTVRLAGTVPANGTVLVRLETYGYAESSDASEPGYDVLARAIYQYPPRNTATFLAYGKVCGANLQGRAVTKATTHDLSLTLSGARPGTIGALVVGDRRVDLPLPVSSCRLYANPVVTVPFFTDLTGKALHALPSWSRYQSLLVRFQDVLVESAGLTSSNGLELAIR